MKPFELYRNIERGASIKIFGVPISDRSIALSQIHNVVEIAGMAGWLSLVLSGHGVAGFAVLAVTLTIKHVLALSAGKQA